MKAYLRSLAARFLRRAQTANDLDEELRSHIQLRADDLERSGVVRAEAERRARIELGSAERFKEECREEMGGNFLEGLFRDARFSCRTLRKSPGSGDRSDRRGVFGPERRPPSPVRFSRSPEPLVDLLAASGQSAHEFFPAGILRLSRSEHFVREHGCDRIVQSELVGFQPGRASSGCPDDGERV
jgi:hypothetical protein